MSAADQHVSPSGEDPRSRYCYVDTAAGSVTHRNNIRRVDLIHVNGQTDQYASYQRGTTELWNYVREHKNKRGKPSVEGFPGPTWTPFLPLDFDSREDPAVALEWLGRVLRKLQTWDVDLRAVRCYFSGSKGFHMELQGALFGGFEPSARLHKHLKRAAELLLDDIPFDRSVYDKLRLWRLENSKHSKTGLYKIRLSAREVLTLDMDTIRTLAVSPRVLDGDPELAPIDDEDLLPNACLVELWSEAGRNLEAPKHERQVAAVTVDARDRQTIAAIAADWPHGGLDAAGVSRHTDYLMPLAGFLAGRTSAEHAVDLLCQASEAAGDADFLNGREWEAQIERLVNGSADRRGAGQPFTGLPTLAERSPVLGNVLGALWPSNRLTDIGDASSFGTFGTDSLQAETEVWPAPDPIDEALPAPRLPLELFPHELAAVAEDGAERIRCPVDYIAWSLIVSLAGLIGRGVGIRPRQYDDWTERLALWLVMIGPPSWLKSPAIDYGTRPLRRQQQRDRETFAQALAEWKDEVAQIRENDPKAKAADLPPEPVMRRCITTDSTVEKLSDLLEPEVSRGLTAYRDELAGLVYDLNRYRNGSDRQFYLQAYSGGLYVVDRVTRGSKYIEDLLLNIVGGIQPEVARDIFTTGPDDGLGARFTAIWPSGPPAWETVDRLPNKAARDALDAVCDRVADADWHELLLTDDFKPQPYCQLVDDARDLFAAWESELMGSLQAGQYSDRHEGRAGKYRGLAARLALVFHVAGWGAGRVVDPRYVPTSTIRQVLDLMSGYVLPMERRVFSEYGITPAAIGGRRIARWLKSERRESFRVREIRRHHWSGLTEEPDVLAALDWLVTAR